MATLGRALIEVRADLSQFPSELKAKLKAALEEGAAGVEFTEVEKAARDAGEKAGEELANGVDNSAKKHMHTAALNAATTFANGFTSFLGRMLFNRAAMWIGLIAAAGTAIGNVLPAVMTLAGLIPAAVGGLVATAATLKLAFHGVGDAISAAFSGDTSKLNEALKGLTPAAQSFVREIANLRPQLQGLQRDVQQAFFVQLEGSLTRVTRNLLPTLRSGLTQLSGSFGQVGRSIAAALSGGLARGAIADVLDSLRRTVVAMAPALGNLTRAFLALMSAGSSVLGQFGAQLASVVDRFSQWLLSMANSGTLAGFFQTSLDVLRQFGSLLGNLGGLVITIVQGLSAGGPQFVGILSTIVGLLKQLFQSDQGSQLLQTIGQLLSTLGIVVTQVLQPLLPAVAHLADAFGKQLNGALLGLLPHLVDLANNLVPLITFVANHADVFGPIAAGLLAFSGLVRVFNLLQPAVEAATVAMIGFDAAADANPIGLLTLAIEAIIAGVVLLIIYWKDVKKWGEEAWHGILVAAKAVGDFFTGLGPAVADFFSWLGDWFSALPGRIVSWVEALPGLLGQLFMQAVDAVAEAIGIGIGLWLGLMIKIPSMLVNALSALGSLLAGIFRDAWASGVREVELGWHNTLAFFDALPGRIASTWHALPGMISGFFRDAWNNAVQEVRHGTDAVVEFAHGLPGRIRGFMDNVGHDILSGLKSGINGIIGSFNSGIDKAGGFLHISLPHLPYLAQGAVVNKPTVAMIGEAGDEVVLPVNNPARAQELLEQSGLANRMAAGASQVTNVNVTAMLGTGEILTVLDQRVEIKMGKQVDRLAGGVRSI